MRFLVCAWCSVALWAVEEPPVKGIELVPLIQNRTTPADPARPWANNLASLTDPDPARHGPAVAALVNFGPAVVPDLERLAKDEQPLLRSRICLVASGIGGPSVAKLLLTLSQDDERRVREMALLALGQADGEGVQERIIAGLRDLDGIMRAAAARAAGVRANRQANDAFLALGSLIGSAEDPDNPARTARRWALERIMANPKASKALSALIASASGDHLARVLQVAALTGEPRLTPALTVHCQSRDGWHRHLAALALATCGDRRAIPALIPLAVTDPASEVASAAASALRRITGYPAGPGGAWELWWNQHAKTQARWAEIDEILANIADQRPVSLSGFSPDELAPLLEAALTSQDSHRPWWPARAWAAIQQDEPTRWLVAVEAKALVETDQQRRQAMVVFLDQRGGASAAPILVRLRQAWSASPGLGTSAIDMVSRLR